MYDYIDCAQDNGYPFDIIRPRQLNLKKDFFVTQWDDYKIRKKQEVEDDK